MKNAFLIIITFILFAELLYADSSYSASREELLKSIKMQSADANTPVKIPQELAEQAKKDYSDSELTNLLNTMDDNTKKFVAKLDDTQKRNYLTYNMFGVEVENFRKKGDVISLVMLHYKVLHFLKITPRSYGWLQAMGGPNNVSKYSSEYFKAGFNTRKHSGGLEYSDNYILKIAHDINPNNKYRHITLLSIIFPSAQSCGLNVQAALDYLKEYPNREEKYDMYMALFKFYVTFYNAIWELEDKIPMVHQMLSERIKEKEMEIEDLREKIASTENERQVHLYKLRIEDTERTKQELINAKSSKPAELAGWLDASIFMLDDSTYKALDKNKDLNLQKQEALTKIIKYYDILKKSPDDKITKRDKYELTDIYHVLDTKRTVKEVGRFKLEYSYYGCMA